MSARGYTLGIDWTNSGDPASPGEDTTADVRTEDLVLGWGRDTVQASAQPSAASLGFVLDNRGGRYSPQSLTSDLAGLVLPGRRVTLTHTDTAGTAVRLFDGILDQPTLDPAARTFTAGCLDAWGRPAAGALSTEVYQGIRTGDAVGLVLDAIGWQGGRAIDPGATIMPFWWEDGTDAATAIEKLVNSEGVPAIAYVQAGVFVFCDRFHRTLAPAARNSAGLFTNVPGGVPGAFRMLRGSITYDHGLRRVVNQATFTVDERAIGEAAEVWSTDVGLLVPAGGSIDVLASFTEPVVAAVTPLEGSGIDSDTGAVTAALSRTSGASIIITLSSAVTSVVNRLALTAQPVTVARQIQVSTSDPSSIGIFGPAAWPPGRAPVWADAYDAQAIADRIIAGYAQPRPIMSFEIANVDAATAAQIFTRKISDRITVRDDQLAVNADFIIEAVEHTIRRWGSPHLLRITAEQCGPEQPDGIFTFDVAGAGFDDGKFGAAGIDTAENLFIFDAPFDATALVASDTFTRTVASGLGTADLGGVWTVSGGVAGDYNVTGGVASLAITAPNPHTVWLAGLTLADFEARITLTVPALALTQPIRGSIVARLASTAQMYQLQASFETDGTVTARIIRRVADADTTLASTATVASYTAGQAFTLAAAIYGGSLSVKIWPAGGLEPATWQAQAVDGSPLAAGYPGLRGVAVLGNTNVGPVMTFDDWQLTVGRHGFDEGVFGT